MKKLLGLVIVIMVFTACKEEKKKDIVNYVSFGEKITADDYISNTEMLSKFKVLKKGDTIDVKFKSKINKVCKQKGCWMRLELDQDNETFVRFKDYGFFMPLNSDNREVIVSGKAYVDIVTVAEQRHYAEDEGLSEEEINKITEDEVTYAVRSNGVLMVE